ncbi:MAG: PorT family protein [Saprospiraceae bacterium]|nr:PorT family protein [Saprospiraceae bacterium]
MGYWFFKKFELSAELFYNQRGATPGNNNANFNTRDLPVTTIKLHYADVLIMANFFTRLSSEGTFYRQNWQVGFSYGRLLGSKTDVTRRLQPAEAFAENLSQNYKSDDFALVAGWSLYFTPRLGLNLRHSISLTSLYKNPNFKPTLNSRERDYFSLTSYFFSAQIFYNFISPKIKKKKKKKEN